MSAAAPMLYDGFLLTCRVLLYEQAFAPTAQVGNRAYSVSLFDEKPDEAAMKKRAGFFFVQSTGGTYAESTYATVDIDAPRGNGQTYVNDLVAAAKKKAAEN